MSSQRHPAWWKNSRGEWFVVVQTILFALIVISPAWLTIPLDLPRGVRAACVVLGLALGLAGAALAFGGLFSLGSNLSVLPHPKDDATLVRSGAYAIVRHPIYSGLILGAVGWGLLNASLTTLIYAAVLFVFFDVKSRREERWLARKFPDYADYRTQVRKLIPFIY